MINEWIYVIVDRDGELEFGFLVARGDFGGAFGVF